MPARPRLADRARGGRLRHPAGHEARADARRTRRHARDLGPTRARQRRVESSPSAPTRTFLPLNRELLRLCHDWQVRRGAANTHDDPAYDWTVIDRLVQLDERVGPVVRRLASSRRPLRCRTAPRCATRVGGSRRGSRTGSRHPAATRTTRSGCACTRTCCAQPVRSGMPSPSWSSGRSWRSVPAPAVRACRRMPRVTLLGIPLDNLTMPEAVAEVVERVRDRRRGVVTFVNAHCVNVAWKDPGYLAMLRAGDRRSPTAAACASRVVCSAGRCATT